MEHWQSRRLSSEESCIHAFHSRSGHRAETLGKSSTQLPVALRREIPGQYIRAVSGAPLSISGFEEAL